MTAAPCQNYENDAPEPCAAEVRRATLYEPPEYCENEAQEGSELCYWHDPDGAEADRAQEIAESRREDRWDA